MTVEVLQYPYTTPDAMQRLFSQVGFDYKLDDLSSIDRRTMVLETIEDATDTINMWIIFRYLEEDLACSRWVNSRATWIADYLLCQRRGNPAPEAFATRYQEILAELELIKTSKIQIPRLPERADFTPAMTNYRVDDRFVVNKIRVKNTISTGGTYPQQDTDPRIPWGDW